MVFTFPDIIHSGILSVVPLYYCKTFPTLISRYLRPKTRVQFYRGEVCSGVPGIYEFDEKYGTMENRSSAVAIPSCPPPLSFSFAVFVVVVVVVIVFSSLFLHVGSTRS